MLVILAVISCQSFGGLNLAQPLADDLHHFDIGAPGMQCGRKRFASQWPIDLLKSGDCCRFNEVKPQ